MTKRKLIASITKSAPLTQEEAEKLVNTIFDSMIKALKKGERVEIRGFGIFSVRQRKSYEGRSPGTGKVIVVGAKRLPFFKVGKKLKDLLNK